MSQLKVMKQFKYMKYSLTKRLSKMFSQQKRIKAVLASLLLVTLCACSMGDVEKSVTSQNRERINIDFDWLFHLGDESSAKNTDFDDQNWRKLDLPHDWSIEGEYDENNPAGIAGGYLPTGIAWYRKHLTWNEDWAGKQVQIEFDGVYMNSEVWVNGQFLGKRPYGYIGFAYDLTDFLKAGDNIISVRVDHSKAPSGRWYTGSGIYRHVWLTTTSPVSIAKDGTWIRSENVSTKYADLKVDTEVSNALDKEQHVELITQVIDSSGKIVAEDSTTLVLPAGKTINAQQALSINNPKLWSTDDTNLYTVRSNIKQNEVLLDSLDSRTGIRSIEFTVDRGFLLNGETLIFQGASMHHDAGPVGAAVPDDILRSRLKMLKAMGVNALRNTHNPFAPEFYDMADEMGFVIMNEAFDGWWTPKAEFDYGLYFEQWWQRDLSDFIRRDRNHPSVVMWSIGNEVRGYTPEQQKIVKTFVEQFDKTRPVTQGRGYAGGHLDIAGFNGHGEYKGAIEKFHKQNPNVPTIGTEVTHTMHTRGVYRSKTRYRTRDNPAPWETKRDAKKVWQKLKNKVYPVADLTETEVFPEHNIKYGSSFDNSLVRMPIRDEIKKARELPYFLGTFRWTAFDYLGESFGWPARTANFGVLDLAGFPKGVYYLYQSQWSTEPMVRLEPHWTHPGKEGVEIPVVVYTNQTSVELFLDGQSLGEKPMTEDMQLVWLVPYKPGELTAVAKDASGKVIKEHVVRSAGKPESTSILADKTVINANRRDVVQLEIDIVDAKGNFVPYADNQLTFDLSGPARLIGVENGDILDLSPHKVPTRKAFMGKALALIQATDQAGDIVVTVRAEGLQSKKITIKAKKPKNKQATLSGV